MKGLNFFERSLQQKRDGHAQGGFTPVGVLISIVVVAAIGTTIAIPSFLGRTADSNMPAGSLALKERVIAESAMYSIIQPE